MSRPEQKITQKCNIKVQSPEKFRTFASKPVKAVYQYDRVPRIYSNQVNVINDIIRLNSTLA